MHQSSVLFILIVSFVQYAFQEESLRRRDREKLYGKSEDTEILESTGPLTACRFYPVIMQCVYGSPSEDKYFYSPDKGQCVRFEPGMCDSSGKNEFMSWQDCQRACGSTNQGGTEVRRDYTGISPLIGGMLTLGALNAMNRRGGYYGYGYPYNNYYNNGYNNGYNNYGYNNMYRWAAWQGLNNNYNNNYLYSRYHNNRNYRQPDYYRQQTRPLVPNHRRPRGGRCRMPDFVSNCAEEKLRLYYDENTGQCKEYTPGYCDRRRENEFDYLQQCQSACSFK